MPGKKILKSCHFFSLKEEKVPGKNGKNGTNLRLDVNGKMILPCTFSLKLPPTEGPPEGR